MWISDVFFLKAATRIWSTNFTTLPDASSYSSKNSLFLKTYDLIPDFVGEQDNTDVIYIASINEKVAKYAINIADLIREEEIPCLIDYRFKNLKNQLLLEIW